MTTTSSDQGHEPLARGQWTVDPAQSTVAFKTKAMGLFPVTGRYDGFAGTLTVGAEGAVSGTLHVDAKSVSTGIRQRDKHLRSKDFFYVDNYPEMTFDLASVNPLATGTAQLAGTLRVRDQAVAVEAPVTITPAAADALRIQGSFEVDHRSAGFEYKRLPRRVQIEVTLVLEPVR